MPEENNTNELGLITLEEGAKLLDIGIVTFKKLIDDKKIPAIQKTDKLKVVRKQDVIDYVNNQVKKDTEGHETTELEKVNEQIELTKKQQDLEALKAGFKTSEEFKQEFDNLKEDREILEKNKSKYEQDVKDFSVYVLKERADIDETKAKYIENLNKAKEIEARYKKKWQLEDEKRKNEQKLIVSHLDELAKTTYNSHPSILGKRAKEKLAQHLEPILAHYGIPPVFSGKSVYIPLSSRLELMAREKDITLQRKDKESHDENDIVKNARQAFNLCLEFYNWSLSAQGAYDFNNWFYKELKLLEGIFSKESDWIYKNMSNVMEHFGAINSQLVGLASRFDKSNHPNNVTDSSEMEYILKVSDEIERLLGVREGE